MSCPPHFFNIPEPSIDVKPLGVCRYCSYERIMTNVEEITFWKNKQGVTRREPNPSKAVRGNKNLYTSLRR
jgi:hypothetical protein